MLCCALVGCNVEHPQPSAPKVVTTGQACRLRIFDGATRARFEEALKAASLPYDVAHPDESGGGIIFEAHGSTCDAFDQLRLAIVGPDLPNGRHIHFDAARQAQFKGWLETHNIPFEIRVRDGEEYVVWKAEDAGRVTSWPFFPRNNPNFLAPNVSGQQSR